MDQHKSVFEIKSLEKLSNDQLFAAFQQAFAGYEIQLNQQELFRMLKRRGYQPGLSFGAFAGNNLVSFTLNGIGLFEGRRTAYDTGTGTIPEFQAMGLAGDVFRQAEKTLKAAGIQQYLLEVLQHNAAAIKLYKKLGFGITRSFNYFHQDVQFVQLNPGRLQPRGEVKSVPLKSLENHKFSEFHPSWQNSSAAIKRSEEDFMALGFFDQNILLGFLITDPQTGDITQIQVHPEHRRKGIGTTLMAMALEANEHKEIKLINSDSGDAGLTKFLASMNIPLQGKQYEMIKEL